MRPMQPLLFIVAVIAFFALAPTSAVRADDAADTVADAVADVAAGAAWAALRAGGHVALVRHASAPGTGDPENFRLDDCATQRNLSAAGRDEARAIGEAIRERGVRVDAVHSSQWCRCLETARQLDLGPVTAMAALNSFFNRRQREQPQLAALRAWLTQAQAAPSGGAAVLVTHQVVITALSGVFPRSGEIVVGAAQADGGFRLVGRIPPPS